MDGMDTLAVERLILVIEDSLDHVQLIEQAFGESSIPHRLVTIADGLEAMDFLYRQNRYVEAARPDLILLDLNISGKDGRDILAELKADARLRRIPIVVLTASAREDDVLRSYSLQGNCYVIKASDRDRLFQIIRRIEEFWLGIVTLPVEQ